MSTKIKLMRLGKMRAPYYRVVVADSRTKRNGRVIETIGKYHPKSDPSFIEVDSERAQYWLGVGAQPTEPVRAILRVTGDWQRFRGEPAPEPMKTAAERPDKKAVFAAAAKAAATEAEAEKPARKSAPAKKAAKTAAAAEAPEAAAEPAETPTETPAETPPAAETPSEATAEAPAETPPAAETAPEAPAEPAEPAAAAADSPEEQAE
ncbi:MAG: small subunit ribosomal protein [Frankiaceae bacterium]|nr:small subunit ribosomal protein [Frankiaceae bacterium]